MSAPESLHPPGGQLSAWLDGELRHREAEVVEEHIEHCEECAHTLEELAHVRRIVRAQPVGDVPDLVDSILWRIEEDATDAAPQRSEWPVRTRLAAVSAIAAAALLFGAYLPISDNPSQTALASQIARRVRTSARALETYRATFSIVERGWEERVGTRRFSAEVLFQSPEGYRMTITDDTDYPSFRWPANDVELITGPKGWWIKEPRSCPPESLPSCAGTGTAIETRAHVGRAPFDGTIGLPTDLVLPLKTLADSHSWRVLGSDTLIDRDTYKLGLTFREAQPLVSSLQEGGLWRDFYPSDPVSLWIDGETGFPLKFKVRADATSERKVWAERLGYDDKPFQTLLQVTASDFSKPDSFAPGTFSAPAALNESDGRFLRAPFEPLEDDIGPSFVAGLKPARAGTAVAQRIVSYAKGMAWLKVTETATGSTPATANPRAEELRLSDGSWAYYLPASSDQGRTIEMFGATQVIRIDTNLPRATARRVANSMDLKTQRLDPSDVSRSSFAMRRVDPSRLDEIDFYRTPTFLPDGYTARAAYTSKRSTGMSATAYYRGPESEFDGIGIRVTQERGWTCFRLLRRRECR